MFESAVFLLLIPLFVGSFLNKFIQTDRRAAQIGVTVVAGGAAAVFSVWACDVKTGALSGSVSMGTLMTLAHDLASHHLAELRSFFPRSGWLLAVVQVGLPAAVLLFGKQLVFKERQGNTLLALALTTVAVVPALLNLPFAPFTLFQPTGHLPVFSGAVAALATASVVAACLVAAGSDERSGDEDVSNPVEESGARWLHVVKSCAGGFLLILALLVAVTPFRSYHAVDTRQGDYADHVARQMLKTMEGRTCLVTNGMLDNHLRIQACMLKRPLTLITLRAQPAPHEAGELENFISSSPLFNGLNRQRLLNALSLGAARFVTEWFGSDTNAARHAVVFATPDLWTACGYRAVPEGILFGGLRPEDKAEPARLVQQSQAFSEQAKPLLARQYPENGPVAALRALLRLKAGFTANELGVFLQESGAYGDAYAAYERAMAIDPLNVSAAINLCELNSKQGLHPELGDVLKKRMRGALEAAGVRSSSDIMWVLQNHGTIHQKELYVKQTALWSSLGARKVAIAKIRKAQALAESAGLSALLENAAIFLQAGDSAKAESCYLAVLQQDPFNRSALVGMCTLTIARQQVQEAEAWHKKALEAGLDPQALRFQTVSIALLKSDTERAVKLLEAATREVPSDMRYWTLLADSMLKRGDTQLVEHQLLPDMQKALKITDHYLIHAIRGMALRSKGPDQYREARVALLKALSLNASLSDVWSTLFELDLAIGNAAFTESDARKMLAIEPDHALANYLMGRIMMSRNLLRESEDFLRRSTEKKATAAACNDLAENLRLQKRYQEAEASVKRALEIEPGLAPALDTWACILCDAGRFEESARVAGEAVAGNPGCPDYQLTLLRAQVKLSKRDEVRQLIAKLTSAKTVIPAALRKEIEALKE